MDFFSSQHGALHAVTVSPSLDPFAQEISRRFSLPSAPPLLTARLSPIAATSHSPLRSPPAPPVHTITSLVPNSLHQFLNSDRLLVLDVRSHATYNHSRIPHALSLSVPSTLLKRPTFSLEKLTEMLPTPCGRRLFSTWKSAARILVYDADSLTIPDGSNLAGLLRKFQNEGFCGELFWLKGGFAAAWDECRALIDDGPPSPDLSDGEDSCNYLRAKRLPSSAFQQVSTTTASQRPPQRPVPVQLYHQVAPPPTFNRPVPANPFYDNIRQNRELEHGITERIPLRLPPAAIARRNDLPFEWLKEIIDKADSEEGTEALAMQFYMIELREQRRLMGVMDHHSQEASSVSPRPFPYSITAGIEKGSKNRYTNIWPFEHARVRLNTCNLDDGSDYINASHVQPIGTHRRYIATQGPLPTTYTDFWTLCWEQNVSIIVMLTKQVEGSLVKCGSYWTDTSYGELRLHLVSSSHEHVEPAESSDSSCFDFTLPTSGQTLDHDKATVRRCFLLSHIGHPETPPRKIIQLQYLGWPDYDVPEDPRGLLDLMREVDVLRSEAETQGPALLHCSAGIGRTGGFIVADAALDGIRREMRKRRTGCAEMRVDIRRDIRLTEGPSSMDVDNSDIDTSLQHAAYPLSSLSLDHISLGHRPRTTSLQHGHGHHDTSGSDASMSDESLQRSRSPGPSVPSTTSGSSTGVIFRPSSLAIKRAKPLPKLSFRSSPLTPSLPRGDSSISLPTTNITHPTSVFSLNPATTKSTSASSLPVSVSSSCATSPTKELHTTPCSSTFDYTDPRRLHDPSSPVPLSSFAEPVRKMLEDMREQRMSLCQSLRQYVFVHRAIIEGALDIVDEERAQPAKRGPSPTELRIEDRKGAVKLSKRPSMEREATTC